MVIGSLSLLAAGCAIPGLNLPGRGSSPAGGGMLKSLDRGDAWDAVNALTPATDGGGSLATASLARVRINPAHSEQLYVASPTHGVYQSLEGGKTWKKILDGAIFDVQINPENSGELLAGGWVGNVAKVFKSTDAGQTWIEAFSESKAGAFVSAITYLTAPTRQILIGLSSGEIIQSTNGGTSWNFLSKLTGRILRFERSPEDARTLYALEFKSGLSVSKDGGARWESLTANKINAGAFYELRLLPSSPGAMYLATDTGLYRTSNRGGSWQNLQLPLRQNSTVVSAMAVDQKDQKNIFAMINATLYASKDGGLTWKTKSLPASAHVRELIIDPKDSTVLYAGLGQPLR